ncbi:hypothetical protein QBC32DRAFT_333428 [Pseudoneurospora amorphoporcata]|uniref:Uncharacterized protein n=1 Tax=Pseudoneurospora amorphoporcata TaxID=241081 RepID=A0AAN6P102_9PEZI|nr:hypothetical protein QBC32DRAFT_333428 [Pseudoneurospora amorphoporcata]
MCGGQRFLAWCRWFEEYMLRKPVVFSIQVMICPINIVIYPTCGMGTYPTRHARVVWKRYPNKATRDVFHDEGLMYLGLLLTGWMDGWVAVKRLG